MNTEDTVETLSEISTEGTTVWEEFHEAILSFSEIAEDVKDVKGIEDNEQYQKMINIFLGFLPITFAFIQNEIIDDELFVLCVAFDDLLGKSKSSELYNVLWMRTLIMEDEELQNVVGACLLDAAEKQGLD